VKRDHWKWGEPEFIQRTKLLNNWGEFIWCEWSLANAVWYSKNLKEDQNLVIRLHSQEIRRRASKFSKQILKPNNIIFVAEHIRKEAIKQFGWQSWKTCFIPNYVNCKRLDKKKTFSAKKTIGIIGVVPKSKRLDRALDVIEKLRDLDDEWRLIVKGKLPQDYAWMSAPGRSDEKDYFQKQFARIENNELLKKGVIYEKFSPRISEFYSRVGYVLSPSDFESFHYSIADGVSSGSLPIVWSWAGAEDLYPKDWIINDGRNAVERILQHSKLAENKRIEETINRIDFIKSNYDIEVILPKMAAVLFD
jgi:glycosyltransferase involved in cell wall biosynthesis